MYVLFNTAFIEGKNRIFINWEPEEKEKQRQSETNRGKKRKTKSCKKKKIEPKNSHLSCLPQMFSYEAICAQIFGIISLYTCQSLFSATAEGTTDAEKKVRQGVVAKWGVYKAIAKRFRGTAYEHNYILEFEIESFRITNTHLSPEKEKGRMGAGGWGQTEGWEKSTELPLKYEIDCETYLTFVFFFFFADFAAFLVFASVK